LGSRRTKFRAALFALFTAGCATPHGAGTALIDNRHIEYVMVNHDSVPIVFENGLGGNFNRAWKKSWPIFRRTTRPSLITDPLR
jgi:hypothetical protein